MEIKKINMKSLTMLIILTLVSILQVQAQKSLSELANYSDKKFKKSTRITVTYPANLKAWRKVYKHKGGNRDFKFNLGNDVGLLTFFLSDFSKKNLRAMREGGLVEQYLTESGGQPIIGHIYTQALPKIKKAVSDEGYNLLLPSDYANDDSKLDAYQNTEIKMSRVGKFVKGWGNYFAAGSEKSPVAPEGYRVFPEPVAVGGVDFGVARDLGFLMDDVAVDGFVSVQVITELKGKKVSLRGFKVTLHGRNPMEDIKGVRYTGGYFSSFIYGGVQLDLKKPIQFAKVGKKSGFDEFEIDGIGEIINRLVKLVFSDYKDKIHGL